MNTQSSFLIPIMGLKVGKHTFHYDVDHHFVNKYENTDISHADLICDVEIKISTGHIEVDVIVNGTIKVPCDRCLQVIDLPIDRRFDLIVKYGEETKEDGEIIYLARNEPNLNLEKPLYDLIRLSLPLVNVYDCENDEEPPCDEVMLDKMDSIQPIEEEKEGNTIWDSLKDKLK